jgi:hypothetical protein
VNLIAEDCLFCFRTLLWSAAVLLAGLLLLLCCWYVVVDVLLGVSCAAFSEAFVWFFRFDSLYGLLYSEKPLYSLLSLLDCWASLL